VSAGWKTKTGDARIIPLVDDALVIAQAQMGKPGPWLFCQPAVRNGCSGPQPRPYTIHRVYAHVKKTIRSSGVRGNVHTTCHTFCSFLANHNVSPFVVMKLMGHSSLSTVLHYYHISAKELAQSLGRVQFGRDLRARRGAGGRWHSSTKVAHYWKSQTKRIQNFNNEVHLWTTWIKSITALRANSRGKSCDFGR